MSKEFSTERLLLNLATWAQEARDPNAGGGTPAAIGSLWQEAGTPPGVPTTLYLKSRASSAGWLRQNLTGLNVYNVKDPLYGAVGDGVTDDTAAINAAVTAAVAAGGGVIYFPPVNVAGGQFYRLKRPAVNVGSIMLDNVHNLIFMGDGYASKIEMFDDSGAVAWCAFQIQNGSTHITFQNLNLSGEGVTNTIATGNQIIQIVGNVADANTGTGHVDILECYWQAVPAQRIGILGNDAAHIVKDVRISRNLNSSGACTSCIGNISTINGFIDGIEIEHNYFDGATISFTALVTNNTDTTSKSWSTIGNQTSSSATNFQVARGAIVWNVCPDAVGITGSGQAMMRAARGCIWGIAGNSTVGVATLVQLSYIGNIVTAGPNGNSAIQVSVTAGLSAVTDAVFTDNVVNDPGTGAANGIAAIDCSSAIISGNVIDMSGGSTASGVRFQMSDSTVPADSQIAAGNLIVAPAVVLSAAVTFLISGTATVQHNVSASDNFAVNVTNGIAFNRGGAQTYADWRDCARNNFSAVVTNVVTQPAGNVGVTQEGPAGPGAQIALVGTTPVANVAAPVGSLCADTAGGQATALWYKETGTGVSGATALWLGIGGYDLTFGALASTTATAARFFATGGLGLPTESTTEIQAAMPRPGTMRNLRIRCTAGTGGGTNTFTVRKNGVNTVVTVGFANTATNGADTTHAFTVVAGDLISVQVTKGATPTTPQTNLVETLEIV